MTAQLKTHKKSQSKFSSNRQNSHLGIKKINYLKFAPSERVVFSLSCDKILSPETMSKAKYEQLFSDILRSGENRCVEKKSRSLTYIKLSFDIFVIKQANEKQITLMKD